MASKKPSKSAKSKAAKVLSSSKSSKAAKSLAARTLSSANTATRIVKSAPKRGTVSSGARKKAMSKTHSSRSKKR